MSMKYPLFVVFVRPTPCLLNLFLETQAGDDYNTKRQASIRTAETSW